MTNSSAPWPTEVSLRSKGRELGVAFDSDEAFEFTAEFLRVESPSAENKGHVPGETQLAHGKRNVRIVRLEPVGNYALRIVFDDGHQTGLYSWAYLHDLGRRKDTLWADYMARLSAAGLSRG
jgi:DUF971 family protein